MALPKPRMMRPTTNIAMFCAAVWITTPINVKTEAQKIVGRRPHESVNTPEMRVPKVQPMKTEAVFNPVVAGVN